MIVHHLSDLAVRIESTIRAADGHSAVADPQVLSTTIRAQRAHAGTMVVALPGARVHGAQFVEQAVAQGAVAAFTDPAGAEIIASTVAGNFPCIVHPRPREVLGTLASAVYDNPSHDVATVGITGTSGKTTTSFFVEAALRGCGHIAGLIGTTGSRINGEPLPSALTTPEAPDLQDLMATMRERGASAIVTEVSSHALRLGRVDGVEFRVGAFLNLSQDHLDFHPSMEDYFHAKLRLFDADADPGSRVTPATHAVVCIDDTWGQRLAARRPSATTVSATATTTDSGEPADWTATDLVTTPDGGQRFTAVRGAHRIAVDLALPGRFNIANALVALAICEHLGVDLTAAAAGLRHAHVPGRVEPVSVGQDFRVLVDYAHKPAAVGAVLDSVREATTGRVAVVLGAGGDRDATKRPLMGAAAAHRADLVIITDDNPRTEDPAAIRRAVLVGAHEAAAGSGKRDVVVIEEIGDRAAAIRAAIEWARAGDTVVIAGKGHETGQDYNGTIVPFDDRIAAGEALRARAGREGWTVAYRGAEL